jgi:Putative restriction endonuclease
MAADQGICRQLDDKRCILGRIRRKERLMKASNSVLAQGPASGEDIERYEVVDGVRVEREPMGAFETVLVSWLCHMLNGFAAGKKLGLAVNEVLFVLNAARTLNRRPDVAFVSYARWPTSVVAREAAWNVVPDLAIEILSPTNLAEEIDRKITDYFQSGVRLVWVFYRIPVGSTFISRRRTSALWNAPTPWMAARYCLAFGYPLPHYTKPWPNQNKVSVGSRLLHRGLLGCGASGGARHNPGHPI